jgi:hypothetical protein
VSKSLPIPAKRIAPCPGLLNQRPWIKSSLPPAVAKLKEKSPPAAYRLSARKSSGELSDSQDSDSAATTPPSGNKTMLMVNVDSTSNRFVTNLSRDSSTGTETTFFGHAVL